MNSSMKKTFRILLPLVVIALAVLGAVILYKTRPIPKPREVKEMASLVTLQSLQKTSQPVRLRTTGTVIPARQIALQAQVGGEVISMNPSFIPGGRLAAGDSILTLDPVDYELALTLRKAEVEQTALAYAKELGMQEVARHEWDLIDSRDEVSDLQRKLILRKPHLQAAQSAMASAKAALRQAEINLERTTIRAPFDAVVLSKAVDLGAQVSPQTLLGQLAGTDEYWVEATLPVDQLHRLNLPDGPDGKGSPVTISVRTGQQSAATWKGHVKKLNSQLEARGRLAQLLLSIPDPLATSGNQLPLLLDSYVQVEIEGSGLDGVFVLPRRAIHDGQWVWIMNAQNRLEIRTVDTLWGESDWVAVSDGLQEGEKLVISDLPAPAPDMLLKASAPNRGAPEE